MTIFEYILFLLVVFVVLPILAFLVMKWATVGFYRGKESFKRQNEFDNVQNDDEEIES